MSAVASIASAQTAMTQQQFLRSMASMCGDSLPASATDADLIAWARGKGMDPAAGWNLRTNLTKEVMAQTLVQLWKLAPGNGSPDAVRILEREGILIRATGGYVTAQTFKRVMGNGLISRAELGRGGGHDNRDDDDDDGGGRGDDDDGGRGDDDDGPRPTRTKPGHGHGDKNHDHTGPPGKGGKPKKK